MDDVIFDENAESLSYVELQNYKNVIGEIGSKLPENYRIAYYVGGGAVGTVLAAKNELTNLSIAVKAVKTGNDSYKRNVVYKECLLQSKLNHDNIAKVIGSAFTNSYSIIFMELLSGGDLLDLIPLETGLDVQKGFVIYSQILDALEFCHAKEIVHLDVKPENIMISASRRVKLIDFGLAVNHKDYPILRNHVGTVSYSAPETFTGSLKPYQGYKADLFSLGVTFLTCITGQRCWIRATLDDPHYFDWANRDWSAELWRITLPTELLLFLVGILSHDPDDRLGIDGIRHHYWFKMAEQNRVKGICKKDEVIKSRKSHCSQPQMFKENLNNSFMNSSDELPLSQPDSLVLMPDLNSDKDSVSIVKRMTRFFSKLTLPDTYQQMKLLVEQNASCFLIRCNPSNLIVQSRQTTLSVLFRIFIYRFADSILVDFRRIRGDGLLFHGVFKKIRDAAASLTSCGSSNDADEHGNRKIIGIIDEHHPYLKMIRPSVGL